MAGGQGTLSTGETVGSTGEDLLHGATTSRGGVAGNMEQQQCGCLDDGGDDGDVGLLFPHHFHHHLLIRTTIPAAAACSRMEYHLGPVYTVA